MKKIAVYLMIFVMLISGVVTLVGCDKKDNNSTSDVNSTSENVNNGKDTAEQYVEKVRNGKRSDKIEVGKKYDRIARIYQGGKFYEPSDAGEFTAVFNSDNTGEITHIGNKHKFTYTDSEVKSPGYYNFKYEFKNGLLYMTADTDQSVFVFQIVE